VTQELTASLEQRLESVVGAEHLLVAESDLAAYAIDGIRPRVVIRPEDAAQAAEVIRVALEAKLAVIPVGARSSVAVGAPPSRYDVAVDVTRIAGIAQYDPGDLTIGVLAGTTLAKLSRTLAKNKQFLPLAVPFFEDATVGGAIACGLDSPLRHFYGTARDFLIGAEFVDGAGGQAKSGGCVVKNVTGYDFHKLLCGSLGTLGVITRLNFRTFPLQPVRRGFIASFLDEAAAIAFARAVAASALAPAVLDILSPEFATQFLEEKSPVESLRLDTQAWTVCVGFEGSSAVCERYTRELARLAREAAAQNAVAVRESQYPALLEVLREAPAAMRAASPRAVVLRFSTVPSALPGLIRSLRSFAQSSWMASAILARSSAAVYQVLLPKQDESTEKQLAYFWQSVGSLRSQLEFSATILFCPAAWKRTLNVWAHASGAPALDRRVKKAFDPGGIFAPGRFAGGL